MRCCTLFLVLAQGLIPPKELCDLVPSKGITLSSVFSLIAPSLERKNVRNRRKTFKLKFLTKRHMNLIIVSFDDLSLQLILNKSTTHASI